MDDGPAARRAHDLRATSTTKGLIYRGERMINWCPRCHDRALRPGGRARGRATGSLWYVRYPLVDDATARRRPASTSPSRRRAPRRSRRHRRRGAPGGRALQGDRSGAVRMLPVIERDDPDHRRRGGRDGVRHRRGEGHARPRPDRLRDRPAPRPADHQRDEPRRHDERRRPARTPAWTASRRAQTIVADLEERGLLEKTEPYTPLGRPLLPLRHDRRAADERAVVRARSNGRWPQPAHRGRERRPHHASSRERFEQAST